MSNLEMRLQALIAELQSDVERPEGRWGMHGHSAVDDDYFVALEYCIKRLRELVTPLNACPCGGCEVLRILDQYGTQQSAICNHCGRPLSTATTDTGDPAP